MTDEQLAQRIDELAERLSHWEGSDPEASGAILEGLGFLRDFWPPRRDPELALDTCNRLARLVLLYEHRLGGDFGHVQEVFVAAVELLRDLAGDGRQVDDLLRRLQDVSSAAARKTRRELGLEPDPARAKAKQGAPAAAPRPKDGGPSGGGGTALFAGDRGFLSEFVSEATEHLEEIDASLLELEKNASCTDTLGGLFRCFHTVKGVADFLGLVDISTLAHAVESLLDRHREHHIDCEPSTLDLFFEAADLLRSLVQAVKVSITGDGELESDRRVPEVIARLESASALGRDPSRDRSLAEALRGGGRERPAGSMPRAEPEPGVASPPDAASPRDAGEGLKTAESAPGQPSETPGKRQTLDLPPTVKVDSRRLDLLLDTIGELVVAVSVANQAAGQTLRQRDAEDEGAARARVDKLTRELQELGTSLRMIPLLSTFRKMMRLSRDLGKRCRKSLQFSFSGEGTELDRTIVQQIQDPLLHILRNAIDHGIEAPEERLEAGKPKVAYVSARAYHKGGSFFIEVADDGRGFDDDRILRKARAAGLVPEGRDLSREELVELVFEPGFTTAETVTSISGRGVGMDVVKRTAERLGGSASIESVTGRGTVVTLRLPLTVAMIEGMVIRVGAQRFIVPTLALTRVHQPRPGEIETVSQRQEFLSFKEKLIPLVRLGRVFEIEATETDASRGVIVIVEGRGRPVGLLVDELLGQQQIVIKGLGRVLQNIPGIAGGAVMPDGKVGLILDVQGILELAHAGRDALLRAVG